MEGPDCPLCGNSSLINNTVNEWRYWCDHCKVRFKLVSAHDGIFTLPATDAENDLMVIDDNTAAVILRSAVIV